MGLGGIVAAYLRLRSSNSEILLAAPRPEIRELLNVTRLVKLFAVHDSVSSALASP
jgi:anti-anti-sigma regulatory factor